MNTKSTLLLIFGGLLTTAIVADRTTSDKIEELASPEAAQLQVGGALSTGSARYTVMADSPMLLQQRQLERNWAFPVKIAGNDKEQVPEKRIIKIDGSQASTVVNTEPLFQFRDLTDRSNDQIGEPGMSLTNRTNQVELLRHRALANKAN